MQRLSEPERRDEVERLWGEYERLHVTITNPGPVVSGGTVVMDPSTGKPVPDCGVIVTALGESLKTLDRIWKLTAQPR